MTPNLKIVDSIETGRDQYWDETTLQRARCSNCSQTFFLLYREERSFRSDRNDKVQHTAYEVPSDDWDQDADAFETPSRKKSEGWRIKTAAKISASILGKTPSSNVRYAYNDPTPQILISEFSKNPKLECPACYQATFTLKDSIALDQVDGSQRRQLMRASCSNCARAFYCNYHERPDPLSKGEETHFLHAFDVDVVRWKKSAPLFEGEGTLAQRSKAEELLRTLRKTAPSAPVALWWFSTDKADPVGPIERIGRWLRRIQFGL
ncbi:MAG: hypothetical protein AAF198_04640 [Pseudomonadota bacterium]